MSNTPHLNLPLLAAAQAQKHVTHNEALAALDALVHLAVIERNRTTPPAAAEEGARYLVGAGATGAFAGHAGEIAFFDLGIWRFLVPRAGWHAYVKAEDKIAVFDGTAWHDLGHYNRDLDTLDRLGIGTAADDVNRLAAKLNAALFTARTPGEGGTGDLRVVLNKSEAASVLSQVYQRAYSGRAEAGLIGSDDFSIRVSADGSLWREALKIDRTTGLVSFPSGLAGSTGAPGPNLLHNAAFLVNQRGFAGGPFAAGAFGFDRWRAAAGDAALTRAADGAATLTGAIEQVLDVDLAPSLLGTAHYGGQSYTVSVENPTASLTVTLGSASGTIAAGSGRRSVTLALGSGETGHIGVRIQAASACTFRRLKLEPGAAATPWLGIPLEVEEARCRRYFQRLPFTGGSAGILAALAQRVSTNVIEAPFMLPVAMRPGAVLMTTFHSWAAGPPSGSQVAFLDSATSGFAYISGTLTTSLAGTPGPNAAVLRLQASGSFGSSAGTQGTLHLGGTAVFALQAEP